MILMTIEQLSPLYIQVKHFIESDIPTIKDMFKTNHVGKCTNNIRGLTLKDFTDTFTYTIE